jgi:pimeloyl-ACP methyl ester carboxylesterase
LRTIVAVKDLTIDLGGPVHVVDHGGDGPPMVMVHGLGGSLVDWRDVAPALSSTHHVWALDLLGFGRTPLGGRQATIGDNVRLVDAFIDEVSGGQPVVLVGNSMGALISLVEAVQRRSKIAGLVLVDPALPHSRGGRLTNMIALSFLMISTPGLGHLVVDRRAALVGAERLVDEALRLCAVDPGRIDPATRQAHIELTRWRADQDKPYRAFIEASRSLVRWLWTADAADHFIRRVSAPTLLIHGDRDRVVEVEAARAAAAIRPDWTFRVFQDTGHIPQMERPGQFLDVVREWLDSMAHPAADRSARGDGVGNAPAPEAPPASLATG